MEGEYHIHWDEEIENNDGQIVNEEVITIEDHHHVQEPRGYIVQEITQIPNSIDQIAAENLIYMAHDGQVTSIDELIEESVEETQNIVECNENEQQYFECQVTEEIITDDWVEQQGEERVEIPVDQICGSRNEDSQLIEDIDVPLPTDQDEYTALRPYPCDFCSRRFRKKVSLMNHMVAHQNDRTHACNLCGARYVRKNDLINHLKTHAHIPEQIDEVEDHYFGDHIESRSVTQRIDYFDDEGLLEQMKPKTRVRGRKPKIKNELRFSESDKSVQEQILPHEINKYPITDPRKPFVCQQCGIAFAREKALLSHSRIHGGDSPYECATCSEMFWDINVLSEHQKSHHFEASNSEYEPENDEESDSEDSKYGEYYCNVCGMSFHRQDLLKRHTKTHKREIIPDNGDSTRHCCNVCGETFAEALDLLAHAEIHARFQPFKCVLCGETFLEEATIKKHLLNVHSNEMTQNSCRLCGKQCKDSKALMKHAWDHSREKNHSCSKCGKNFHNKARLKRHMMSHRNKSVTCEVCNEEFPDGRSLMNHRHSHSNASGRQFQCHECGKTFGSRSSQQIHVRIHTGERPYGCRYCWKAFADGGTLRKHERIHTGEKPYACSVCPRAFNQRVVLREHIRAHHSSLDSLRGTYFCTVCSSILPSSNELIQHLIHHSDMNTAMQRQPVTGPRKYKRRRKLKPHEIMKMRQEKSNNSDEIDYSDLEMTHVDDILGINSKNNKKRKGDYNSTMTVNTQNSSNTSGRNRKYSGNSEKPTSNWQQKLITPTTTDDTYNGVFQNLENALNSIDSLVVNTNSTNVPINSTNVSSSMVTSVTTAQTSGTTNKNKSRRRGNKILESPRPKMIHTQKTRVAVEDGKRKTRTLITRTEPTEIEANQKNTSRLDGNRNLNDYDVIPDINSVIVKQEQVPTQSDLFDAQLLLEAATMRKDSDKFNPDIINDLEEILRSPIKSKSPPEQQQRIIQNKEKSINVVPQSSSKTSSLTTVQKSTSLGQSKVKKQSSYQSTVTIKSVLSTLPEEDLRRSARLKRNSVPNKKYLEFDMSPSLKQTTKQQQQQHQHQQQQQHLPATKIKQEKSDIEIKIERNDDNNLDKICVDNAKIKSESYFQCEMCCAVFQDRAQLLVHVPIHI